MNSLAAAMVPITFPGLIQCSGLRNDQLANTRHSGYSALLRATTICPKPIPKSEAIAAVLACPNTAKIYKEVSMNRAVKHIALIWLSLCILTIISRPATAQTWVASTGTVDESSLLTYQFTNGDAFVRGNRPGQVTLRFNVLPVGDLLVPVTQACCEGRALWLRFLDNGNGAQVLVKLKQYNVTTGAITTVLSFDSNDFPPQPTFQDATPNQSLGPLVNFSFATGPFNGAMNQGGDNVYYLEATLIRSAPGGTPGLASISIVRTLAP
ncbi:MAG TPA: hypothetical protein VN658_07995 [Candidatus Acidoferrales bacterium]|nr:hypothetical protein [Candidatus Acidoferrales bacterium]